MRTKVAIIGGGLAGLSAGCYAAMNGFEAHIFEHHTVPGGVAAAWKRGDYLIDGGIHFVMGYKPGTGMFKLLNELGAAEPTLFTDMNDYGKFIHESSGVSLAVTADIDELASRLKTLAPVDAGIIDEIFNGARKLRGHDLGTLGMSQPPELSSIFTWAKETWQMLPFARYFAGRYSEKMSDFIKEVHTPWLKDFFCYLFMPESPVWFVMMCLAIVADKQTGYLARGCQVFALEIEKRFKKMGGTITYNATVAKILTENDRAVGIQLDDGKEFQVDDVISCGDSYNTIFNLLEGRYIDEKITRRYETRPLCRPYLMASYGVKREFKDDLPFNTILLRKPVMVGDEMIKNLFIRIFNYSAHFATPGKSVFQIEIETGFDHWFDLQKASRTDYESSKANVAKELLSRVEKYYPGITGQVEVTDVATPYTTWRYTLNHRASWGGWMLSADNILQNAERRLPGLRNFYMAGHWVLGGVPGVLYSGRHAVQLMCHDDGKKFVAASA